MIGRTIHEFRIEKKLAEGGMGAVYLARHQRLADTLKVIKVLLPQYAMDPVIRRRFEREAQAASKLKHANILGIDNFGALDDGQLFLMIPYLDGEPLDEHLRARGGRLSEHRALHLVVQLADALDHAHAAGIVHRDLKPGNVFVVPTNQNPAHLKLLDFGIAKLLGRDDAIQTRSGVAIGTPMYMAVEQYEHADEVTPLADLYSLAVVIWELVTGRPPWNHSDPAVLYFLQRTELPERPPAGVMSKAWADALLAALSVDPAARPRSVRELAITLASGLPAIGRLPSGAEILADLAPHFIQKAAPGDETVRNAAEIDRIGPLLWPPRETVPKPPEPPEPPRQVVTVRDARGPATTLSGATFVQTPSSMRAAARWKLALVAGAACACVAIGTREIATRVTSGATPAPAATRPSRADARPPVPRPDPGAGSAHRGDQPAPVTLPRVAPPARDLDPMPASARLEQAPPSSTGTKAVVMTRPPAGSRSGSALHSPATSATPARHVLAAPLDPDAIGGE